MTIRRIGQSAGKTGFGRNPQRLHERLPTGPAGGDDKVQTATAMATAGESPCGRLIRWSWVQVPPGSLVHVYSSCHEMTQRDNTPGFPAFRSPVSSHGLDCRFMTAPHFAPLPYHFLRDTLHIWRMGFPPERLRFLSPGQRYGRFERILTNGQKKSLKDFRQRGPTQPGGFSLDGQDLGGKRNPQKFCPVRAQVIDT